MKNAIKDPSRKRRIRNDLILIASVLIITVVGALLLFFGGEAGNYAVVSYDGNEIARYPLDTDREETILTGDGGGWRNVLVIKDGKASVTEADCPDGLCVSHRSISKIGETIVCLPHKLVISIVGEEDGILDGVA